MRSKGNAPTAEQKRWREAVRGLGSIITGGPAVIHHPIGCTGKHNKIAIGHWWIIPLTEMEHKQLHDGRWSNRKEQEKKFFEDVCVVADFNDCPVRPPYEVYEAIMDYHL